MHICKFAAAALLLGGAVAKDPVVYTGTYDVNFDYPDGGLRPSVGVQNYQVVRASRIDPEHSDGYGWTYHHSPMMQYWRGKMYVLCNSGPVDEDADMGHVLLMVSTDLGTTWSFPKLLFPTASVQVNGTKMSTINNHRIGWWTGPSGRLYAMTAYYPADQGVFDEDTNRKWYGYALREVREGLDYGDVYFIADNLDLYPRESLPFPYYTASTDDVFLRDCEALRADKLVTLSWWEAIRPENFHFPQDLVDYAKVHSRSFAKAAAFYHRLDNKTVVLWKKSYAAVSADEGTTWTEPVSLKTLGRGYDKVWAERTSDGKFGVSWTPPHTAHSASIPNGESPRYPLIVSSGSDGITFDLDMINVNPEVTRRYYGRNKNYGPSNYQRGLLEGNTDPVPGGDMWLAYSMSKEDIWVSRIPMPITGFVSQHVNDTFEDMTPSGIVKNWNIFSPKWAPVRVNSFSSSSEAETKVLELRDADPNDFAKAERTFPQSKHVTLSVRVRPGQTDSRLDIDVWSHTKGAYRPVRMWFDYSGEFMALSGCTAAKGFMQYTAKTWYKLDVSIDVQAQKFTVSVNGELLVQGANFCLENRSAVVEPVERLIFRTGPWRGVDVVGKEPGTDKLLAEEAVWYIDDVFTRSLEASHVLV